MVGRFAKLGTSEASSERGDTGRIWSVVVMAGSQVGRAKREGRQRRQVQVGGWQVQGSGNRGLGSGSG